MPVGAVLSVTAFVPAAPTVLCVGAEMHAAVAAAARVARAAALVLAALVARWLADLTGRAALACAVDAVARALSGRCRPIRLPGLIATAPTTAAPPARNASRRDIPLARPRAISSSLGPVARLLSLTTSDDTRVPDPRYNRADLEPPSPHAAGEAPRSHTRDSAWRGYGVPQMPPKQPPEQHGVPDGVQGALLWMHGGLQTLPVQVRPEQHRFALSHAWPEAWHAGAHLPALHTFGAQHWPSLVQFPLAGAQQTLLVWSQLKPERQSSLSLQYAPLPRIAFAVAQIPFLQ